MRRSTMIVVLITFALLLSVPGLAAEKENLALRATVTVDSTFTAYPEGTQLNDGELNDHDPEIDASWGRVAWASAEVAGDHWIELALAETSEVSGISIYWARDAGEFKVSSHIVLQYWDGVNWVTITELRLPAEDRNLRSTEVTFAPVTTDKIRVLQPSGGGPVYRPNIMWVAEVQVWGTPAA